MVSKQVKSAASFALTAVLLAMSTAAFSADNGALTREQVRAEYTQARTNGTLPATGEGLIGYVKPSASTLTREAVQAEYFAARMAGTLQPNGEGQVAHVVSAPSTLTREAVQSEYYMARMAGTLPPTGERG